MVIDVTAASFETDVIERSREVPVVVDFWASWCGPCRALGPVLERLAEEDAGAWVLAKLDTDANPEIAQRYRIQGIPAVKAFVNGEVVDEFTGALPMGAVRHWLDGIVPNEADTLVAQAVEARDRGETDAAIAALRQALEIRRDHPEALLSLAELIDDADEIRHLLNRLSPRLDPVASARRSKVLLGLESGGDVDALTAAVEARPDDLEARWQLAHALAAGEQFEGALANLLEIVKRDRTYRDDGARKAMLEIFEVVGSRSPLADGWRNNLATVLY